MLNRDQFSREVAARDAGLSGDFIVPILQSSDNPELAPRWRRDVRRLAEKLGFDETYGHGIVMEHAKRNLMVALLQERMNVGALRAMIAAIARALGHMHANGQVHADFKPLNAVRTAGGAWKLIDFDATVRVGERVGAKTSTAWNPPEVHTYPWCCSRADICQEIQKRRRVSPPTRPRYAHVVVSRADQETHEKVRNAEQPHRRLPAKPRRPPRSNR